MIFIRSRDTQIFFILIKVWRKIRNNVVEESIYAVVLHPAKGVVIKTYKYKYRPGFKLLKITKLAHTK